MNDGLMIFSGERSNYLYLYKILSISCPLNHSTLEWTVTMMLIKLFYKTNN